MTEQECDVAWASHACSLPPKHEGDHACIDFDDEEDAGEAHSTCPRTGPEGYGEESLYNLDLFRYNGEFCDICGPIEPAPHINGFLDHIMRAHPRRWAEECADGYYANYLGDGVWIDRDDPRYREFQPQGITLTVSGPIERKDES